jgi:hypothetical protein
MNESDLNKIIKKPNYGISAAFSKPSIKSGIRPGASSSKDCDSWSLHDLESNTRDESLRAKKLQIGYSGKVRVVIRFYRRRLADYSRAISEKALIDCLQYAGLIQGDSETEIWLEDGGQEKVGSNEEERTEIELYYPEVDLDNSWVQAKDNKLR